MIRFRTYWFRCLLIRELTGPSNCLWCFQFEKEIDFHRHIILLLFISTRHRQPSRNHSYLQRGFHISGSGDARRQQIANYTLSVLNTIVHHFTVVFQSRIGLSSEKRVLTIDAVYLFLMSSHIENYGKRQINVARRIVNRSAFSASN